MAWSDEARAASAAARRGGGGGMGPSAIGSRPVPMTDSSAATVLSNGHPKSGLVGIHSASAISRGITKLRLAFRNSDG